MDYYSSGLHCGLTLLPIVILFIALSKGKYAFLILIDNINP